MQKVSLCNSQLLCSYDDVICNISSVSLIHYENSSWRIHVSQHSALCILSLVYVCRDKTCLSPTLNRQWMDLFENHLNTNGKIQEFRLVFLVDCLFSKTYFSGKTYSIDRIG